EVNDLTVVTPQSLTLAENTSASGNVLSGAVDAEGSAITVTAGTVSTAQIGSASCRDGVYTYTPAVGYDGPDSYTYTATTADGEDSATGVVNSTVTEVNDLTVVTPQSASLAENTSASGNVLSGAVDAEGSAITVTAGTVSTA